GFAAGSWSTDFIYCYSCLTLSGFGNKNMNKTTMKRLKLTLTRFVKENTCMTIPEGLNLNNIKRSSMKNNGVPPIKNTEGV
ncbi:MAG: hypothetical protein KAX28_11615, partial [Candidatus Marinimicrobia bacterium]|nr:hypothetical protein [Candidatus Neomarinimicrobiota bacterium]